MDQFLVFQNLKAMIVEDDSETAEYLKNVLEKFFDEVYVSHNGKSGLETFEEHNPDIIFVDILMPQMSGLELIREIRSTNKKVKIIITTAYNTVEYLQEAIPLKVEAYLVKPIGFEEFLKLLTKLSDDFLMQYPSKVILENGAELSIYENRVCYNEKTSILTPSEVKILQLLLENKNQYVSKETIDLHMYYGESKTDSALKGLINKLRHKIGKEGIQTQSGFGYKVNIP